MAHLRLPRSLLALLAASLASAQTTLHELSFGIHPPISTNGGGVPGWRASNQNHEIQILTDRVILTPPVPGNAKGALWSERSASTADWSATLEFRASGQETGSGNLQIWYTKDRDSIGFNSVYNAEKFDGLVLVIDQYGGSGGKVRGFLNDGGVNFRASASLESLAFGHCDYSYRNLGRPSKVKISNQGGLTVTVDDKTCFSSDKISLPAGYYFGLTASTGENPDSFEVNKFVVQQGGSAPPSGNTQSTGQIPTEQPNSQPPQLQKMDANSGTAEDIPDRNADEFKSQSEQFADLHNRLQILSHRMGTVYTEVRNLAEKIDAKHTEVLHQVQNVGGSKETGLQPETVSKINSLYDRVINMEAVLNIVRDDVESKDYRQKLQELSAAMTILHHTYHNDLPEKITHSEFDPPIAMVLLFCPSTKDTKSR